MLNSLGVMAPERMVFSRDIEDADAKDSFIGGEGMADLSKGIFRRCL
jgi:hypothetical protein